MTPLTPFFHPQHKYRKTLHLIDSESHRLLPLKVLLELYAPVLQYLDVHFMDMAGAVLVYIPQDKRPDGGI